MDEATKQKVQAIMDQTKTELGELGVDFPAKGERKDMFAKLDDATKQKAQAIMDQMKTQLAEIGVNLPTRDQGHPTKAAE
ncbi:hypothetical protein [Bacillus songklensis]|uniref:hypothetical protein n=1 Tax=Bacillus songklensis TaxID=1069116 RepID=UPI003671D125